jgi:hypothetical protein
MSGSPPRRRVDLSRDPYHCLERTLVVQKQPHLCVHPGLFYATVHRLRVCCALIVQDCTTFIGKLGAAADDRHQKDSRHVTDSATWSPTTAQRDLTGEGCVNPVFWRQRLL